jgi:hypothetical protein
MTCPQEACSTESVDAETLAGQRVEQVIEYAAGMKLVSSGRPLTGYKIDCPEDDETIGPIAVSGPSVGRDAKTGVSLTYSPKWLRTGDLGFRWNGELYVCGRNDDYVVVRGRNLYAPAIEGRAVACGLPRRTMVLSLRNLRKTHPAPQNLIQPRYGERYAVPPPGTIPADATDVLGAPVATSVMSSVLSVEGARRTAGGPPPVGGGGAGVPENRQNAQIGSTNPARANERGGEPFAKAQDSRAHSAGSGDARGSLDSCAAMAVAARRCPDDRVVVAGPLDRQRRHRRRGGDRS